VRHAEKAAQPAADPPLTSAGRARAEALAGVLKHARVASILTSQFARTRETAAPLAAQAGVAVQQAPTTGGMAQHIATTVAIARRATPDSTVVIVGHSNTVPELARALGHPTPQPIADCEYDGMLVLQLSPATPSVVSARYGAPSRC
jgi:phosphohistidine phosphatase SixA